MKKYLYVFLLIALVSNILVSNSNIFQAAVEIHGKQWRLECVRDLDGEVIPCSASIHFDENGHFLLVDASGNRKNGTYKLEKINTAYSLYLHTDEEEEVGIYLENSQVQSKVLPSIIFKLQDKVWNFVAKTP